MIGRPDFLKRWSWDKLPGDVTNRAAPGCASIDGVKIAVPNSHAAATSMTCSVLPMINDVRILLETLRGGHFPDF